MENRYRELKRGNVLSIHRETSDKLIRSCDPEEILSTIEYGPYI